MSRRSSFSWWACLVFITFSSSDDSSSSSEAAQIRSVSSFGTCSMRQKRQANSAAFAESLYEASDPILQLNSTNFDDEVFNRKKPPKAHLVEFYLSWCGHCRHFAPVFVKFAEDVKHWNSLVEVSAINCALEYNRDVCDANRVERVPYLRYFNRNAKQYDDAFDDTTAYRSLGQLRRQLVDLVADEYEQNQYPDWPSLKFLANSSKVQEAWVDVPSEARHVVFIFERPEIDNYTAIETLLDFLPHYPRVIVRRIKNDHPLAQEWDIVDFPTLALVRKGESAPAYFSELRRMLVNDVLAKLAYGPAQEQSNGTSVRPSILLQTQAPTTRPPPVASTTPETLETRRAKYYVSETDLLLAVSYALRTEVPYISKNIAGSNFTNLTRFVDTLRRYFPKSRDVKDTLKFLKMPTGQDLPRSERARRFFADLSEYLASKNSTGDENGPSISADEWKAKVNELEARHDYPFPNTSNWQHCRGSKWKYRGYTCGVWSLFHTLTVNAYLEDGLKAGFDPFGVLNAIKGYVSTFFGCTYCAKHFVEMVTQKLKMEEWVKYSSDSVMYLWRAHNTVNKRLAGDETEDPEFPKRQFPPEFLCPDCQLQTAGNGSDWVYRSVLRWLIQYYTNVRPHQENGDTLAAGTTPVPASAMGNLTNTGF